MYPVKYSCAKFVENLYKDANIAKDDNLMTVDLFFTALRNKLQILRKSTYVNSTKRFFSRYS